MRFLEHPGLSCLSALLNDLDVGDRVLCGRLELFTTTDDDNEHSGKSIPKSSNSDSIICTAQVDDICEEPKVEATAQCEQKNLKTTNSPQQSIEPSSITAKEEFDYVKDEVPELKRKCNQSRFLSDVSVSHPAKRRRSSSSLKVLETHSPAESKKLLVQLVNTMNACFPDYDFSSVSPEAFEHIENFVTVYTTINYHLSFIVERIVPGFLQDLWASIRDAINLRNVSIYSYINPNGKIESDPHVDDELCLFSFDYFFVDESSEKILFFSCMTKRKLASSYDNDNSPWSDSDDEEKQNISQCSLSPRSSSEGFDENDDLNDETEDLDDDGDLLFGEVRYES